MLRWLMLGLIGFGLVTGFRHGWLVVQWNQLLQDAGLTLVDPDQSFDLHEFIFGGSDQNRSPESSDQDSDSRS